MPNRGGSFACAPYGLFRTAFRGKIPGLRVGVPQARLLNRLLEKANRPLFTLKGQLQRLLDDQNARAVVRDRPSRFQG
jgi:hypothetical protein